MAQPHHLQLHLPLLLLLLLSITNASTSQQPSQLDTLLKIQSLLNYPPALSTINTSTADLCSIEPTPSLTIVCYQHNLTQLHLTGTITSNAQKIQPFSSHSLFETLALLPGLKVLSMVSLGLWGPLPVTIGHLSSLEILNLSSNYFAGSLPVQLSLLTGLQTLVLDHNHCSGSLPGWISSLQTLSVLSLKNNSLTGVLPSSLTSLQNLRVVSLSSNRFSGELPNLRNLTNLQVLDLEENSFGPRFPTLHNKLVTLVLKKNVFQFNIPEEIGSFSQLQRLDISLNGFVGPFLPSLLSLPSITHLDIHGNKLKGMLLKNTSCSASLEYVDLSSNLLTGELPDCFLEGKKVVFYSRNCLSNQEQVQNPTKFCSNEALAVKIGPEKEKNKSQCCKPVVASSMAGGIVGVIAVVGFVLLVVKKFHYRRRETATSTRHIVENVSTVNTVKLLSDARHISETMKLGANLPAYRTFALEELKEATNNFDGAALVADGSHCQVYKGKLIDSTLISIKSMKMRKRYNSQILMHHIELISKLRHNHLVSALGHCLQYDTDTSNVSCIHLIFEFVPNVPLRNCLSGFAWTQRLAAVLEVAKGIQFLHTGIVPGIFSNNVKITDVLLDPSLHVKLSSYNLPLLVGGMGDAEVSLPGRKANASIRVQDEDKSDVYDIGVILLEIIIGRPITSQNEVVIAKNILLQVNMITDKAGRKSIVDPQIKDECSEEMLKTVMELCVKCLSSEPTARPSIEDIIWNLQFATQVQHSIHKSQELT